MLTLEKCKLYLRIDTDFENTLIEHLMEVAESYLIDGVTDYEKNYAADEKYQKKADLLKMVIVSELFNNRDPKNDNRNNLSYTTQSMMAQLNYHAREEVASDEDSGQSNK